MTTIRPGRFETVVPLVDELPLDHVPNIAAWSENYCFNGYDYERRTGFWLHLGRWIHDPSIWREEVYVFLPDGTIVANSGFGHGRGAEGPAGALLSATCIAPGLRWRMRYVGPAQPLRLEQIMRAPIAEPAVLRRLELDVEFEAAAPMWYFGERDNVTWGRWHVEQHGRVVGSFSYGGEQFQVSGHGYRDHSRGPRDFAGLDGHCWIQGRFADGESFAVFQMWHRGDREDAPALGEATVVRGGKPIRAQVVRSPRLNSHYRALDSAVLVLGLPGEELQLEGVPLANLAFSFADNCSHLRLGMTLGDNSWPYTTFEQPALFRSGSRLACGWMERSFRRNDACFDREAIAAALLQGGERG